jgi:CRISPR-associated protein Csy1
MDYELVTGFREAIASFLEDRFEAKKKQKEKTDFNEEELRKDFLPATWIDDAARRVTQLQLATHILKAAHQSAKGTSLYCEPSSLPNHGLIGSCLLSQTFQADVDGNAAALDVFKFLSLEYKGVSLLRMILEEKPEVFMVLSDDRSQAGRWVQSFAKIIRSRREGLSSHTLAKQVYWLTGEDPVNENEFHLLLPLFESSLAHKIHGIIENDLYGETAKAARKAKKEGNFFDSAIHEYPNLAIRKLGGDKPQNISQLNLKRNGKNYLLSSTPPLWRENRTSLPFGTKSFFEWVEKRPTIQSLSKSLKKFLESDPPANLDTRIHRDDLVEQIIGEIFQSIHEIHSMERGWSSNTRCRLSPEEKFLLDPEAQKSPPPDWKTKVSRRFGNWLNSLLGKNLPMGDTEHEYFSEMIEGEPWCSVLEILERKGEENV